MFISFIDRFETQAFKNSQNVAISSLYEKLSFTYDELNTYSNKIAHALISLDIKKGDVVGFSSDKTLNSYVALLGLLKLGVVLVPLDLEYPAALLEFIVHDSKMSCIVSNTSLTEKITNDIRVINLENSLQNLNDLDFSTDNPRVDILPEDLIYIIYTSGSTGKPKGICMSHGAVSAFLTWERNYYDYVNNEKVLQFSPLNFDIFFQECLTSWGTGNQLVVLPNRYRKQVDQLLHFIVQEQINKIILPYVIFVQLAQIAVNNDVSPTTLKKIISTGEALITTPSINAFMKKLAECKFYNLYGASENQVVSICQLEIDDVCKKISIGKPVANNKVFILDEELKLIPAGEPGILYVASELLCSGYLNKENLNADRFIANLYQTEKEKQLEQYSKLYKTGDIVKYLTDGNLEYIGRDDFQVKIRGFRVELGEIETILLNYPGIKQSVVLVNEYKNTLGEYASNKYLVAYYVAEKKIEEQDILNYLATQLPAHMVPSIVIHLLKLPLTLNGKVDKKALPEPEFISHAIYMAPSTELEKQIGQCWEKAFALPQNKIGIDDDFFSLGGNSILAISLVNALTVQLDMQIAIAVFLQLRTIRKIAHYIATHATESIKITKNTRLSLEQQQLSFAQERLWFIEKYESGSDVYNELMVFHLAKNTEIEALVRSINNVLSKHEILRTVIKETADGSSYQQVLSDRRAHV